MRQRQKGMTAIGFICIAVLVGLVGYGALRLVPVYMTQMKLQKLMTDLKAEYDGNGPTANRLQNEIGKRLDIDAIDYPRVKDFVISKADGAFRVELNYVDSVPYIANISLTVEFDNSVEIRQ